MCIIIFGILRCKLQYMAYVYDIVFLEYVCWCFCSDYIDPHKTSTWFEAKKMRSAHILGSLWCKNYIALACRFLTNCHETMFIFIMRIPIPRNHDLYDGTYLPRKQPLHLNSIQGFRSPLDISWTIMSIRARLLNFIVLKWWLITSPIIPWNRDYD